MYCPKCGTQNIDDAKFCRGCGADIALVPQAMTGSLPDARADKEHGVVGVVIDPTGRRHRHRDGVPKLDKAVKSGFMGIAFLIIAIIMAFTADRRQDWWYWLLIPAFAMIGGGVAEYIRYKQSRGEEIKLPGTKSGSTLPPPARVSALPPRNTAELVQPPSVTESTTRHLDLSTEAPTRHIGTPVEKPGKEV